MSTSELSQNSDHLRPPLDLVLSPDLDITDGLEAGLAESSSTDENRLQQVGKELIDLSERATTSVPEANPETTPRSMYARVLPKAEIENYIDKDDARAINIFVADDQTIKIGERELELSGHELYLFNALLKLRALPAVAAELQAYGFSKGHDSARTRNIKFSETVENLSGLLRFASGRDVIAKTYALKIASYRMDPNLVVTDRRIPFKTEKPPVKKSGLRAVKKDKETETHYKDLPLKTLLDRYGQHKKVKAAENRLVKNAKPEFDSNDTLGDYMNMTGQYDLLRQEEVESIYDVIELGLTTLATLDSLDNLPPDIESLLIAATIAQRTMFLSNLRLVISIAMKFKNYDKIDLIHEGNEGLNKAIARYDYHTGFKFSTYATYWIKQAMGRAIANQARPVRLPVKQDAQAKDINRSIIDLTDELKTKPTTAQLMERTGYDEQTITEIRRFSAYELTSLDAPLDYDSQSSLLDVLGADRASSGMEEMAINMSDNQELLGILFRAGGGGTNIETVVLTSSFNVVVPFFYGLEIPRGDGEEGQEVKTITYEKLLDVLPKGREPTNSELGQALGYTDRQIIKMKSDAILHLRQGPLPPGTA